MKVNGYRIQQALKTASHLRDVAAAQFDDGKTVFPGEEKVTSEEAFRRFVEAENRIARLQTAQSAYNHAVMVDAVVPGEGVSNIITRRMPLAEAIRRVGAAGRMEKMWRSVAVNRTDRYSYRDEGVRDKDSVYATKTTSPGRATEFALAFSRYAGRLREAIQLGNATELEMDVDESLFL